MSIVCLNPTDARVVSLVENSRSNFTGFSDSKIRAYASSYYTDNKKLPSPDELLNYYGKLEANLEVEGKPQDDVTEKEDILDLLQSIFFLGLNKKAQGKSLTKQLISEVSPEVLNIIPKYLKDKGLTNILENYDTYKQLLIKSRLKALNIDIDFNLDTIDNQASKDNNWDKDSTLTNNYERASDEVVYLFGSLVSKDTVKGLPKPLPITKTWNIVQTALGGTTDLPTQVEKLKILALKHSWVNQIIDKLGFASEGLSEADYNTIRTSFFDSFAKANNTLVMGIVGKQTVDNIDGTLKENIKADWKSKFFNSDFVKIVNDKRVLNPDKLEEIKSERDPIKFLSYFGITLTEPDTAVIQNAVTKIRQHFLPKVEEDGLSWLDSNDSVTSILTDLLKLEAAYQKTNRALGARNADGEYQHAVGLHDYFTRKIGKLQDGIIQATSKFEKFLFKRQIVPGLMQGIKAGKDAKGYDALSKAELYQTILSDMFSSEPIIHGPRTSDKKTENILKIVYDKTTAKGLTNSQYLNQIMAFDTIGEDLYKRLYMQYKEDFVKKNPENWTAKGQKEPIHFWNELFDIEGLNANSISFEEFKSKLDVYLNTQAAIMQLELIDLGLINKDLTSNLPSFILPKSYNAKSLENRQVDLTDLLKRYSFNTFLFGVEITNFNFGSLALVKPDEFFKRTAGPIAEGKIPRVDEYINQYIESQRPAYMDKFPKGGLMRVTVSEEQELPSTNAEKYNKAISQEGAYDKVNIDDAQGKMLFETYKEWKQRLNEWSPFQEQAWKKLQKNQLTQKEFNDAFPPGKPVSFSRLENGAVIYIKTSVYPIHPNLVKGTLNEKLYNDMIAKGISLHIPKSGIKLSYPEGLQPQFVDGEVNLLESATFDISIEDFTSQLDIAIKDKMKQLMGTQQQKLIVSNLYENAKITNPEFADWIQDRIDTLQEISDIEKDKLANRAGIEFEGDVPVIKNYSKVKEMLTEELMNRELDLNTIDAINELIDENGNLISTIDILPSRQKLMNILNSIVTNKLIKLYTNGAALVQVSQTGWELSKIDTINLNKKNLFTVTPIQSADKKATIKASIATKYIGFGTGITGSSTEEYRKQAGKFANVGNYTKDDVVFVSIGGKRGSENIRKEQQDKTIEEALKAISQSATLITDNKEYTEKSTYNEGEKRLSKRLIEENYKYFEKEIEGQLLGFWQKGITNENIKAIETSIQFVSPEAKLAYYKNNGLQFLQLGKTTGAAEIIIDSRFKPYVKEDGTLDERMLQSIGYRIPTQGLNSILHLKVVGFLPVGYNQMVIMPREITTQGGSDFDVDKLNLFVANVINGKYISQDMDAEEEWNKLEELKTRGDEASNKLIEDIFGPLDALEETDEDVIKDKNKWIKNFKLKQLQNKIIEQNIKILEHKQSVKSLLTPNSADQLKELSKAYKGKDDLTYSSIFNPKTQVDLTNQMFSAKALVGVFAAQSTHHVLSQQVGLHFKTSRPFYFDHNSVEINGKPYPTLGGVKSKNGMYIITDRLGNQYLTASVDAAKDPFLFYLGCNLNTGNLFALVERLGGDVEMLVKLIRQPIIQDYLNSKAVNDRLGNKFKKADRTIIRDILQKYKQSSSEYLAETNETVSPEQVAYYKEQREELGMYTDEMLNKKSGKDFNKIQMHLLDDFLYLQDAARVVSKSIATIKFDTAGPGKDIVQSLTLKSSYENFVRQMNGDRGFTLGTLEDVNVNSGEIKEGVNQIFEENSELANIGTPEQYSQYLDTIFPDSKVKDIVYHGSKNKFDIFDKSKLGSNTNPNKEFPQFNDSYLGFHFTSNPQYYRNRFEFGSKYEKNLNEYLAVLNIQNPKDIADKDEFSQNNIQFVKPEEVKNNDSIIYDYLDIVDFTTGKRVEKYTNNYVVFEPEQIHILGSKQDIEGFKEFVKSNKLETTLVPAPYANIVDKTLLNVFYKSSFNFVIDMYKDMVAILKPEYNNLRQAFELLNNPSFGFVTKVTDDKSGTLLYGSMINMILQRNNGFKPELFFGNKTVVNKILEIQKDLNNELNTNYLFTNFFNPEVNQDVNLPNIVSVQNKNIDSKEADFITQSFGELKKLYEELYNDLIEASLFQTGVVTSPVSFYRFIPHNDMLGKMKSLMKADNIDTTQNIIDNLLGNIGPAMNNIQKVSAAKGDTLGDIIEIPMKRSKGKTYINYIRKSSKGETITETFKNSSGDMYIRLQPSNYKSLFYNFVNDLTLESQEQDELQQVEPNNEEALDDLDITFGKQEEISAWGNLEPTVQNNLKAKGITENLFNNSSLEEQETLKNCHG